MIGMASAHPNVVSPLAQLAACNCPSYLLRCTCFPPQNPWFELMRFSHCWQAAPAGQDFARWNLPRLRNVPLLGNVFDSC